MHNNQKPQYLLNDQNAFIMMSLMNQDSRSFSEHMKDGVGQTIGHRDKIVNTIWIYLQWVSIFELLGRH